MDSSTCDFPEDVVFQILLWLPVMTLLRFKSVCKSWRSLIESSTFTTQQHLHNIDYNGKGKVISRYCSKTYRLFYGDKFELSTDLGFDRHWYDPRALKLLDCCNGIICLYNICKGEVALWNPATRQLRPLPESPIPRRPDYSSYPYLNQTYVAFGFDVSTNDYKVVRIIVFEGGPTFKKQNSQVEVYSLSTDSWEIIHKDVLLPLNIVNAPRSARNGMCFWFGYSGDISLLLSFNLSNNVIGTVPLPESCDYAECIDFMNDKLALIYPVDDMSQSEMHRREGVNRRFEIWVLQDYHVNGSWTKHHTLGPFDGFCPGRFSMNGECVLVAGQGRKVFLYDIVTEEMIILHDTADVQYDFISYNESLVQI
ncbi:hypothetical protein ACHQM5_021331 [Ranunculus cassubicifolius]